jgi:hypothetical protein
MTTNEIAIGFVKVKEARETVKQKLHAIRDVKDTIRHTYVAYVEKEKVDCFGLDSFLFQNKLIELEEIGIDKIHRYIDNRMYGDYFKLFGMIRDFLKANMGENEFKNVKEFAHAHQYPVYKDLDKFKVYDFDMVNQIHADIISVVEQMQAHHQEGERRIEESRQKLNYGINIDNYVTNQEHMNEHIQMKTKLYIKYLSTYHAYHHRMLMRFHERIDMFYRQIDEHMVEEASEL